MRGGGPPEATLLRQSRRVDHSHRGRRVQPLRHCHRKQYRPCVPTCRPAGSGHRQAVRDSARWRCSAERRSVRRRELVATARERRRTTDGELLGTLRGVSPASRVAKNLDLAGSHRRHSLPHDSMARRGHRVQQAERLRLRRPARFLRRLAVCAKPTRLRRPAQADDGDPRDHAAPAGECLRIESGRRSRSFKWNPISVVRDEPDRERGASHLEPSRHPTRVRTRVGLMSSAHSDSVIRWPGLFHCSGMPAECPIALHLGSSESLLARRRHGRAIVCATVRRARGLRADRVGAQLEI